MAEGDTRTSEASGEPGPERRRIAGLLPSQHAAEAEKISAELGLRDAAQVG